MDRSKDQVLIVTGGAHGIGRAYCEGLAQEGARVVVAEITAQAAAAAAAELAAVGQDALAERRQARIQSRAINRAKVPQDLVGAVVFLCSNDSDFVTGQTLVVDGGVLMH